jgi:Phage integrase family
VSDFGSTFAVPDPAQGGNGWRSAWRTLTKKAGLPGFRFHDLRHCAVTQLAENGASDLTIMAIAGHVSRRMLERYSHVRMEAKRTALEALAVRAPKRRIMTQTMTQMLKLRALVLTKLSYKTMVGPNGFEPSTSSVSRKRSRPTELRAYVGTAVRLILTGGGRFRQR